MNLKQDISARRHNLGHTRDCPLCIIVVEDERAIANILQPAFRAWGYDVFDARNGQEGLEVVETQSVDGILLDMHMLIMNGPTMLDELRWTVGQGNLKATGSERHCPKDYPLLVTFTDITDPKAVKKVEPHNLAATFGKGVSL